MQGNTTPLSPPSGDGLSPAAGRRTLTPQELYEQRKAWGKKWGALVKQVTAGISEES